MTFDTETMAELHASQGRVREALAIYRRLASSSDDPEARARRLQRIAELEGRAPAPHSGERTESPRIVLRRHPGARIAVEWAAPAGTATASTEIELLLLVRSPEGMTPVRRTLPASAPSGTTIVEAQGLHSARAALGTRTERGFVPIARTQLDPG